MRLLSVRYTYGCSKSFHFLFFSTTKNLRVYFYLVSSLPSSIFHRSPLFFFSSHFFIFIFISIHFYVI